MQKTADKKQKIKCAENDAGCRFGRVYAFRVSPAGDGSLALKIRILGGFSRVCPLGVAKLPVLVAQIDSALADGECEFEIGGERFSASEKLLGELRKELFSYCCTHRGDVPDCGGFFRKESPPFPPKFCSKSRGASGANRVRGGVSTPSKTKASARAVDSAARQICNSAPKQPRGWQKCAVENPLGVVIRTKRGRTSVVVAVRKVGKFQPEKQK